MKNVEVLLSSKATTLSKRQADGSIYVKKLKRRRSIFRRPMYLMLLLLIFFTVFTTAYIFVEGRSKGQTFAQTVEQQVIQSVKSVNEVWKPDVKMFQNRYTSVLLIGTDVREPIIEDNVLKSTKGFEDVNTDSMMQLVYDHQKNVVTVISLPRDLGIEYEDECLQEYQNMHARRSINHIYKLANLGDCPGGGIEMLKKYVEKITGFPVNYYAMVTFESFLEVIDVIGQTDENGEKGLYVDIPEAVSSLYPGQYWTPVYFSAGRQFLNKEEILIYARIRVWSNDYERARRQQVIVDALSQRLMDFDSYNDPQSILQLIQQFNGKAIFSEVGFDEIRSAIELSDKADTIKIQKVVLDNELGGLNQYLTMPTYTNTGTHTISSYYLIPTAWRDNPNLGDKYYDVKSYIRDIVENPEIYKTLD